jgi:hypothetical protein
MQDKSELSDIEQIKLAVRLAYCYFGTCTDKIQEQAYAEIEKAHLSLNALNNFPKRESIAHNSPNLATPKAEPVDKPKDGLRDTAVKRAVEMLHVAAYHCEQYAPENESFYDNAECDGSCIADDCRAAATELAYQNAIGREAMYGVLNAAPSSHQAPELPAVDLEKGAKPIAAIYRHSNMTLATQAALDCAAAWGLKVKEGL